MQIALSTHIFVGYGLDMIFDMAKKAGYHGIELALWTQYDARNTAYIHELTKRYDIPVLAIQTSHTLSIQELEKAIESCMALGVNQINIQAPTLLDTKTMYFIYKGLPEYRKKYADLQFNIINPSRQSLAIIPIPKYRFTNIADIVKYANISLDISHLDDRQIDDILYNHLDMYLPSIHTIYISDRNQKNDHLSIGDGNLHIKSILHTLYTAGYAGILCVNIIFDKSILIDHEKVSHRIISAKTYISDHYTDD